MIGRIYDPTLGRFLQADPFIQAPSNTQNYNRYSYVLNNPMSYTDPSGYFFKKLLKSIGKNQFLSSVISIGLNFVPGCQAWCSAAFNAATTYALTGSLGVCLRAFGVAVATAQVFSQIGDHFSKLGDANLGKLADMLGTPEFDSIFDGLSAFGDNLLTSGQIAAQITSHAIVGGIASALQGGKFGHGFFSAGVTKGVGGKFLPSGNNLTSNEIARGTVVSAVIGGTTSVIT